MTVIRNVKHASELLFILILCCVFVPSGTTGMAAAPAADVQQSTATKVVSGHPVSISVPSVGINIPIVDGVYTPDTATWTLNHATAQFATSTAEPNEAAGNTFIYGHNNHLVFKYLLNISPGDMVQIRTANGYSFYYRYVDSVTVSPEQVSIIDYSQDPVLTIQTCVGPNYQSRRMFHFGFVKYVKD